VSIVGARPQFIKAVPVGKVLRAVTTPYESPDAYHVTRNWMCIVQHLRQRGFLVRKRMRCGSDLVIVKIGVLAVSR